ncbi:hypothetical protein FNH05_01930 [Amycolatopsis rhizosphaerae]|uniref:Uncharacterized protein n=1 Tax=Amycolatopsis rhizosphaerae TaxID=2053003 RepID=A0A558DLQ5_9PSEU|nr:hypothetical protein [Amycolatopsis rhizosphaerae]TVT61903.1 hypothetical protein FNH05_01930 [Amycolatopsis rhizosphaerae]
MRELTGQAAGAFGYGVGHLQRERAYLAELANRLNEALGKITKSDHVATGILNQATSDSEVL